jgi:hypothetical protein
MEEIAGGGGDRNVEAEAGGIAETHVKGDWSRGR